MAKPNFQFQKRQKELDRKKKNDEKMQRKLAKNEPSDTDTPEEDQTEEEVAAE